MISLIWRIQNKKTQTKQKNPHRYRQQTGGYPGKGVMESKMGKGVKCMVADGTLDLWW